jgi:predicted  nucleic acid-binding Zn-ribbon protein
MVPDDSNRARQIALLEREAELLVALQLDLIAQLEFQLRAVHRTMRHIERLRNVRNRVGPELSNGERGDALAHLAHDLTVIEEQAGTQRQSCHDMQDAVTRMQSRVIELRQRITGDACGASDHEPPFGSDQGPS